MGTVWRNRSSSCGTLFIYWNATIEHLSFDFADRKWAVSHTYQSFGPFGHFLCHSLTVSASERACVQSESARWDNKTIEIISAPWADLSSKNVWRTKTPSQPQPLRVCVWTPLPVWRPVLGPAARLGSRLPQRSPSCGAHQSSEALTGSACSICKHWGFVSARSTAHRWAPTHSCCCERHVAAGNISPFVCLSDSPSALSVCLLVAVLHI